MNGYFKLLLILAVAFAFSPQKIRESNSPSKIIYLSFGSGGVIPNCKYAILVAIRPRAVRIT